MVQSFLVQKKFFPKGAAAAIDLFLNFSIKFN